jgi:hypothetical protein
MPARDATAERPIERSQAGGRHVATVVGPGMRRSQRAIELARPEQRFEFDAKSRRHIFSLFVRLLAGV